MRSTGSGRLVGVGARLHRREIGQMLALRPRAEITHHVGLDIGGKDFAFGNALGDAHAEIAGAGADVGDKRRRLQMQRVQDLFRLLPGVAFRVVELFRPFFSVVEAPMETFAGSGVARMATHMLMLRWWLGRGLRPCDVRHCAGPASTSAPMIGESLMSGRSMFTWFA